jgi:hypothetical protein
MERERPDRKSTEVSDSDSRTPWLAGLIDYAGLFPPAQLNMPSAIQEYRAAQRSPHAWLLERFICPSSGLEAAAAAGEGGDRLRLVIVIDEFGLGIKGNAIRRIQGIFERARDFGDLKPELLETKLIGPDESDVDLDERASRLETLRDGIKTSGYEPVKVFVEVPLDELLSATLPLLSKNHFGAKVRCGTDALDSAPPPDLLAQFITGCVNNDLDWKATAGLHHAFRYQTPRGDSQHGFVNLLAASALAETGASNEKIAQALQDSDEGHFALNEDSFSWRDHSFGNTGRGRFFSYGTCSFAEPIEDLMALGWLTNGQYGHD